MEKLDDLDFETALRELDLIVERLEGQEQSLEEALSLFERGQMVLAHCQNQLAKAELKIRQLTQEEM